MPGTGRIEDLGGRHAKAATTGPLEIRSIREPAVCRNCGDILPLTTGNLCRPNTAIRTKGPNKARKAGLHAVACQNAIWLIDDAGTGFRREGRQCAYARMSFLRNPRFPLQKSDHESNLFREFPKTKRRTAIWHSNIKNINRKTSKNPHVNILQSEHTNEIIFILC